MSSKWTVVLKMVLELFSGSWQDVSHWLGFVSMESLQRDFTALAKLFGSQLYSHILWWPFFCVEPWHLRELQMVFSTTSSQTGASSWRAQLGLMELLKYFLLTVLEWELFQPLDHTISFIIIATSMIKVFLLDFFFVIERKTINPVVTGRARPWKKLISLFPIFQL